MLQAETTDPERLGRIFRHSAQMVTQIKTVRGSAWWQQVYENVMTVTYGDKTILEPFDTMSVSGDGFW